MKSNEELRWKIKDFGIFQNKNSKKNPQNQKLLDLDQYS